MVQDANTSYFLLVIKGECASKYMLNIGTVLGDHTTVAMLFHCPLNTSKSWSLVSLSRG